MNVRRFGAVLICAVLLLSGAACGGGEGSITPPPEGVLAEQVRDSAIAAEAELDTCQFDMDMTMHMWATMEGETYEFTMVVDGEGAIDVPNEEMYMDMDISMEMTGLGSMEVLMEVYLVGDWSYMRTEIYGEEIWLKTPMTEELWEERDIVSQLVHMLLDVEVELVGTQTVGGTECYVLDVVIDMDDLEALMALSGAEEGLSPGVDWGEVITEFSVRQWVATDTYFTRKLDIDVSMVFTPESLGIPSWQAEDFYASADMAMTMLMYDFYEPVSIELPDWAEDAVEVESFD